MAARHDRNPLIYASGGLAAAWVVAAWLRPESNFFLFPFLIAAILPLSYRLNGNRALSAGAALGAATAGFINAVVVAALLALVGKLDGPPLIGRGGLVLEATLVAILGAAIGAAGAMLPRTGR